MEEEPVRIIRESARNLLKLNRQVHKDELSDVRRSIETLSITPDSIEHVVNRLKTKSAVHVNELHALKNSILDNTKTIELVLSTHGAVRGLVRELSGSDVKRQCAAAGCCCNLALGDTKACLALAKAAGPYLVAALDNLSTELSVTSAWALGNMAGSGSLACATLAAQGALGGLAAAALLARPGAEEADAAMYALAHFAYQMRDELSPEYVEKIVQALSKLEVTPASARLLSMVFCHESPPILPSPLLYKIMESLSVSTEKHINACKGEDICCEVVYLLRTLANITVDKEYGDIVMKIVEDKQMGCIFKQLLLSDNILIKESLLWFLGNLYSCNINNEFFNGLVS